MRYECREYGVIYRCALLRAALLWAVTTTVGVATAAEAQSNEFSVVRLSVGAGETSLLIADLNGDAHPDLAIASEREGTVAIRLGDGAGGLRKASRYGAGVNPTGLANADFNADGVQDLVVANHEQSYATVLLGEGGGRYGTQPLRVLLDVAPHPHRVAAADLNGDKKIELIADSRDKRGLFAVSADGAGGFVSPGTAIGVSGAPYLGFALGDLNSDNRLDIVTPNRDALSVLLNSGRAEVSFSMGQALPMPGAFAVGVGDFDGDGHLDVIAASERDGANVAVFLGDGKGEFGLSAVARLAVAPGAKTLAVGDTDGDGRSDAVVCSWNASATLISLRGTQLTATALPLGDVQAPWGLAMGDLNQDGRDDIVISDGEGDVANAYLTKGRHP